MSNHTALRYEAQGAESNITTRSGDFLLVPVALTALWTLAYQLVLVTRLPALTVVLFFLLFAALGYYFGRRFLGRNEAVPGKGYTFHLSHLFLLLIALGCGTVILFVLRPNQDDVVYFHRALSQLAALSKPIFIQQTSVDMKAAAFSPVHLATSHELLMALLGHWLRIDPLYFYQVVGHCISAFSIPFVFYWCARCFGMSRWAGATGAVLVTVFLLIDSTGLASFGNTAFTRMWQGKAIVWILFPPVALSLTYRFLVQRNSADILWLTLLAISGVGLSNSALYLVPAVIGCAALAMLAVTIIETRSRVWTQWKDYLPLAIPLIYPVAILFLLKINIIPKPIDTGGFGPVLIPWREGLDYVIGRPAELVRDVVILLLIPVFIVRGQKGRFLFGYICAVCLLCLNPLLSHFWMHNITAACYFRLVYLLPIPLLCVFLPLSIDESEVIKNRKLDRALKLLATTGIVALFVYGYRGLSISPRNQILRWKSPLSCQLRPANVQFAQAAGPYIAESKLLAPAWTASCELPLIFPRMKVVAPRLVTHYFANVGNRKEGALRRGAQAFVEGEKAATPQRAAALRDSFTAVIRSGRANAVAAPVTESDRVLAALQEIDPRWHRVLEAGGLVLMLP